MPNYAEIVEYPYYRNLAVNPGGEKTGTATWRANSGVVDYATGESRSGSGSIRYTVTEKSAGSYHFGPMGPDVPIHLKRFRIPPSGAVAAKVFLKAPQDVWVQLRVWWYVREGGGKKPAELKMIAGEADDLTDIIKLTGGAGWRSLQGRLIGKKAPDKATHFQVHIVVYGSGGANPDSPAKGTRVFADEMFVPDNGRDTEGVPPVIGGQGDARWEGTPNNSTSTNKPLPDKPPVTEEPPSTDPDEEEPEEPPGDGEEAGYEPPAGEDGADPPNPEWDEDGGTTSGPRPPRQDKDLFLPWGGSSGEATVEDLPKDPGYTARPTWVVAAENVTWRSGGTRFSLRRDVQVSNLILNSVDSGGTAWVVTDIEGWWTTPEPEVPDLPHSWFDGSFETRGRYTARTFTLSGSFIPANPGQTVAARERLIRAVNLVHRGGWFMTHEDPVKKTRTKGSKVWMVGQPLISTASSSGKTDFQVTFRAPDPVKYGIKDGEPPGYERLVVSSSSQALPGRPYPRQYLPDWSYPAAAEEAAPDAAVVNQGNVVVWPVMRVSGPTSGPLRVYNAATNQTMRITRQLHYNETLVIDCATRQVTMNGGGNFRFYLDIDTDWMMIQPGENKITFAEENLGSVRTELEVMWRSGWIG